VTRIVAGTAKGRRLAVPSAGTRPTSERAREALFSTLASLLELEGVSVLDLYAGSGALGLEALSRGAERALLVEADAGAARVLRENCAVLGRGGARSVRGRAEQLGRGAPPAEAPFELVFADPPYALDGDQLRRLLGELAAAGWFAPGAVIVVERGSREAPWSWPDGFEGLRDRRYGEAALWYGRWLGESAAAEGASSGAPREAV
jgi:16S rRNA (guanine966-N2)-methyltransferase